MYKIIAVLTALCVECTSLSIPLAHAEVIPQSAPSIKKLNLELLKLPTKFGEVVESHSGNGAVIIVQDAHAIPDAQRNIANVISYLQNEYGVGTVALEGASGDLDPQIFRSFPDKKLLRQVMKGYMDAGEIAGGTAAAIFSSEGGSVSRGDETKFIGVEDWDVYEEGLGLYLSAMEKEPELLEKLNAQRLALNAEKEKVYSKALLEVDQKVEKFYENAEQLTDLIKVLGAIQAPKVGSELEALWKEVKKSHEPRATGHEKDIEVRELAVKVERFLSSQRGQTPMQVREQGLSPLAEFNSKKQEWMTGEISPEAFALYLKETAQKLGLKLEMSSDLMGMVKDQHTLKSLEGTKLFRDLEVYIQSVKQSLIARSTSHEPRATTGASSGVAGASPEVSQVPVIASKAKQSASVIPAQAGIQALDQQLTTNATESDERSALSGVLYALDQRTNSLRMLTKLSKLELSREEWNQLKLQMQFQRATAHGPRATKKNASGTDNESLTTNSSERGPWLVERGADLFVFHLAFYLNAEERDEIFFKNLVASHGPRSTGHETQIIVAGGFHAEGLTSRLKAAGIGYALVMPKINHIPENNSYRSQMRGEVSWKDYFEVENGRIHLYKAFVRATRDRLLSRATGHEPRTTQDKDVERGALNVDRSSEDLRLLKSWRDQIIRDLSDQGQVQRAAWYTRYMDEVIDERAADSVKRSDDLLMKVDNFIRGLRGLEKTNQLNSDQIATLLKANMAGSLFGPASISQNFASEGLVRPIKSPAKMRASEGSYLDKAPSFQPSPTGIVSPRGEALDADLSPDERSSEIILSAVKALVGRELKEIGYPFEEIQDDEGFASEADLPFPDGPTVVLFGSSAPGLLGSMHLTRRENLGVNFLSVLPLPGSDELFFGGDNNDQLFMKGGVALDKTGTLRRFRFSKPVSVDVVVHPGLRSSASHALLVDRGVSTLTRPEVIELVRDKEFFGRFLEKNGIRTPRSLKLTKPSTGEDSLESQILKFLEENKVDEFVIKPVDGSMGVDVLLFKKDEVSKAVEFLTKQLQHRDEMLLQERIINQRWKDSQTGRLIDWNLRVLTTSDETGVVVTKNMIEVRHQDYSGKPVNKSQGSAVILLDEFFDRLELSTEERQQWLDSITSTVKDAHEKIEVVHGKGSAGLIGWDLLMDEAGEWVVLEGNGGSVGGLGTIESMLPPEKKGAALLPVTQHLADLARQAHAKRPPEESPVLIGQLFTSTSENLYLDISFILMNEKKYEDAEYILRKALARGHKNLGVYLNLGFALINQDKLDEAVKIFNEALNSEDGAYEDRRIYLELAYTYYRMNQIGMAEEVLRRAIEKGFENDAMYTFLAKTLLEAPEKKAAEAEAVLLKAISNGFESAEIYAALGVVLIHMNRLTDAETLLLGALEKGVENQLIYESLGRAMLNQEHFDGNRFVRLEKKMREAIEKKYESPLIYSSLGGALVNIGDVDNAKIVLLDAINKGHESESIYHSLIMAWIGPGDAREAEDTLRRAAKAGYGSHESYDDLLNQIGGFGLSAEETESLIELISELKNDLQKKDSGQGPGMSGETPVAPDQIALRSELRELDEQYFLTHIEEFSKEWTGFPVEGNVIPGYLKKQAVIEAIRRGELSVAASSKKLSPKENFEASQDKIERATSGFDSDKRDTIKEVDIRVDLDGLVGFVTAELEEVVKGSWVLSYKVSERLEDIFKYLNLRLGLDENFLEKKGVEFSSFDSKTDRYDRETGNVGIKVNGHQIAIGFSHSQDGSGFSFDSISDMPKQVRKMLLVYFALQDPKLENLISRLLTKDNLDPGELIAGSELAVAAVDFGIVGEKQFITSLDPVKVNASPKGLARLNALEAVVIARSESRDYTDMVERRITPISDRVIKKTGLSAFWLAKQDYGSAVKVVMAIRKTALQWRYRLSPLDQDYALIQNELDEMEKLATELDDEDGLNVKSTLLPGQKKGNLASLTTVLEYKGRRSYAHELDSPEAVIHGLSGADMGEALRKIVATISFDLSNEAKSPYATSMLEFAAVGTISKKSDFSDVFLEILPDLIELAYKNPFDYGYKSLTPFIEHMPPDKLKEVDIAVNKYFKNKGEQPSHDFLKWVLEPLSYRLWAHEFSNQWVEATKDERVTDSLSDKMFDAAILSQNREMIEKIAVAFPQYAAVAFNFLIKNSSDMSFLSLKVVRDQIKSRPTLDAFFKSDNERPVSRLKIDDQSRSVLEPVNLSRFLMWANKLNPNVLMVESGEVNQEALRFILDLAKDGLSKLAGSNNYKPNNGKITASYFSAIMHVLQRVISRESLSPDELQEMLAKVERGEFFKEIKGISYEIHLSDGGQQEWRVESEDGKSMSLFIALGKRTASDGRHGPENTVFPLRAILDGMPQAESFISSLLIKGAVGKSEAVATVKDANRSESRKNPSAVTSRDVLQLVEKSDILSSFKGMTSTGVLIDLLQANSQGVMSMENFLRMRGRTVRGGYSLGLSTFYHLYMGLSRAFGLTNWITAYAELELGITAENHTAEFMEKITSSDKTIVFFVPNNMRNEGVTRDEMNWIADRLNPSSSKYDPAKLKNVVFVFGAYEGYIPKPLLEEYPNIPESQFDDKLVAHLTEVLQKEAKDKVEKQDIADDFNENVRFHDVREMAAKRKISSTENAAIQRVLDSQVPVAELGRELATNTQEVQKVDIEAEISNFVKTLESLPVGAVVAEGTRFDFVTPQGKFIIYSQSDGFTINIPKASGGYSSAPFLSKSDMPALYKKTRSLLEKLSSNAVEGPPISAIRPKDRSEMRSKTKDPELAKKITMETLGRALEQEGEPRNKIIDRLNKIVALKKGRKITDAETITVHGVSYYRSGSHKNVHKVTIKINDGTKARFIDLGLALKIESDVDEITRDEIDNTSKLSEIENDGRPLVPVFIESFQFEDEDKEQMTLYFEEFVDGNDIGEALPALKSNKAPTGEELEKGSVLRAMVADNLLRTWEETDGSAPTDINRGNFRVTIDGHVVNVDVGKWFLKQSFPELAARILYYYYLGSGDEYGFPVEEFFKYILSRYEENGVGLRYLEELYYAAQYVSEHQKKAYTNKQGSAPLSEKLPNAEVRNKVRGQLEPFLASPFVKLGKARSYNSDADADEKLFGVPSGIFGVITLNHLRSIINKLEPILIEKGVLPSVRSEVRVLNEVVVEYVNAIGTNKTQDEIDRLAFEIRAIFDQGVSVSEFADALYAAAKASIGNRKSLGEIGQADATHRIGKMIEMFKLIAGVDGNLANGELGFNLQEPSLNQGSLAAFKQLVGLLSGMTIKLNTEAANAAGKELREIGFKISSVDFDKHRGSMLAVVTSGQAGIQNESVVEVAVKVDSYDNKSNETYFDEIEMVAQILTALVVSMKVNNPSDLNDPDKAKIIKDEVLKMLLGQGYLDKKDSQNVVSIENGKILIDRSALFDEIVGEINATRLAEQAA